MNDFMETESFLGMMWADWIGLLGLVLIFISIMFSFDGNTIYFFFCGIALCLIGFWFTWWRIAEDIYITLLLLSLWCAFDFGFKRRFEKSYVLRKEEYSKQKELKDRFISLLFVLLFIILVFIPIIFN